MAETCVTCGKSFVRAHEMDGNAIWIDPEPTVDGDLVLRGDPDNIPPGEFVAAFHDVGTDGDVYLGIAPNAPRYRKHTCS